MKDAIIILHHILFVYGIAGNFLGGGAKYLWFSNISWNIFVVAACTAVNCRKSRFILS